MGVQLAVRGVQSTISNHQIADLQTGKQQIDHQLIDELLICQWKLMKFDKLTMDNFEKLLTKRSVIDSIQSASRSCLLYTSPSPRD